MSDEGRRRDTCDMPEHVGCRWSDEAAERAVKKTFAILGVNVHDPKQVEDFREDLRFGKSMRKAASYGALTMIGAMAAAITLAVWYGIKAALGFDKA